eukprot:4233487-Alexandrium_andersonii.AAC.1
MPFLLPVLGSKLRVVNMPLVAHPLSIASSIERKIHRVVANSLVFTAILYMPSTDWNGLSKPQRSGEREVRAIGL